jgi:hypothetical protein
MHLLAPDVLELTRGLSAPVSGLLAALGLLLWLFGGHAHRFWLSALVTVTGGVTGLALGRDFALQPLVAGLFLALAAGALALALARIGLFVAGGLVAVLLMRAAGASWSDPGCFLVGGLVGVAFYRLWVTALSSALGALLVAYGGVSLLDAVGWLDGPGWAARNGELINWALAALAGLGVVVQFVIERRRKAGDAPAPKKKDEPAERPAPAPPPPPPPPPPPTWWQPWKDLFGKKAA